MKSVNAIIEKANISINDNSIITLELSLNMGQHGCVTTLSNISLGNATPCDNLNSPTNLGNYMAYFISKIFEVTNTTSFNELKNKPIRAIFKNHAKIGDTCIGIQSFLNDTIFFIPSLEKGCHGLADIMDEYDYNTYLQCEDDCITRQNIHASNKLRLNL